MDEKLDSKKDLFIYIFTRLFDFNEKLKAGEVEQAALSAVHRYVNGDIDFATPPTFVPFRDTAQDEITEVNKSRIIYLEDLKRLDKSTLILGFLDGQTKDEGVCFEIGYAYSRGIPSIGLFTDFIRREFKGFKDSTHLVDPIILCMLTKIVYNYQIAQGEDIFESRLRRSLDTALEELSDSIYGLLINPIKVETPQSSNDIDIYIDIGGGRFEWERILMRELSEKLTALGYKVESSSRNYELSMLENSSDIIDSIRQLGMRDILRASSAKLVITCSDMEKMSSGSAAIHGLARGLNKKLLLVDSGTIDLVGDGTHRMSRNLMIDQSSDDVARKYDEVPQIVQKMFNKAHFE
ncbi:MAG: hypothetical protein Kow0076_7610 [Francisella sp.]